MPIAVVSFLTKSNPNTVPFIVQDTDIRGGFRVVDTNVQRDAIHAGAKRPGMIVLTVDSGIYWQLASNGTTWNVWNPPGSGSGAGGTVTSAVDPLSINALGQLSITANRILPANGLTGQIPVRQANGTIAWQDNAVSGAVNTRTTVNLDTIPQIDVGSNFQFDLVMSKTVMLIDVTVNAPDLLVSAYSTTSRDEMNPYTFQSASGRLTDVGISELAQGAFQYNRRYAFLANRDSPPANTHYWRIDNLGSIPVVPILSVTYLILE